MTGAGRRSARLLVGVLVAVAACGSDAPDATETAPSDPPATDSHASGSPVPVTESPATEPPGGDPATASVELPPMEVVAALGYPRDLLDRGRVNIRITREGDEPFVVLDKQLIADFFEPAPVEARRSTLPPDGRVVSLQTLFGDVVDCADPAPVTAVLDIGFTYGDAPDVHRQAIPLTDASTLDDIRDQACTVREVLADNDLELANATVDGETMTVDLVVTRRSGARRLSFDSIKGTVLFGASTEFAPGSPERVLEPDEAGLTIPLVFDVNRCDSHAVAETTRKFGLDVYVGVDGDTSQRIDVPIEPILPQLETMLERCKARTGQ